METAILCLVVFVLLLSFANLVCMLMVGSVVLQIMEAMAKLPDELRSKPRDKKDDKDRPWWTFV